MKLSVKPLHPLFAAEVTGLDLRRPASAAEARAFVAAMDQCGVGVLPGQFIDDEQQVAFARLFGELEMRPIQRGRNRYPGADERIRHHEIFDVSEPRRLRQDAAAERRAARLFAGQSPVAYRQLVPPGLGDVFDAVGAHHPARGRRYRVRRHARRLRRAAAGDEGADRGLTADHSIWHSREQLGGYQPNEEEREARPGAFHPLVRHHPLGAHDALSRLARARYRRLEHDEARALLHELMAFATEPRFIYRHKWRVGDLVMWDNRCTMHRATPFEDTAHVRDMRRTTVRDNEAVLIA